MPHMVASLWSNFCSCFNNALCNNDCGASSLLLALETEFDVVEEPSRWPESDGCVSIDAYPTRCTGKNSWLYDFEEHLLNKRLKHIRFALSAIPWDSAFCLEATGHYECMHLIDARAQDPRWLFCQRLLPAPSTQQDIPSAQLFDALRRLRST